MCSVSAVNLITTHIHELQQCLVCTGKGFGDDDMLTKDSWSSLPDPTVDPDKSRISAPRSGEATKDDIQALISVCVTMKERAKRMASTKSDASEIK